jgi:two-component system C4-dicarboxylate transport sensor histidine kinase DctB
VTAAAQLDQADGQARSPTPEEVQESRREADPLLALATHQEPDALPGTITDLSELQRFANAGRLVASVAHEMRNALASAQSNLSFLADALVELDQPSLAEAAADAQGAIERALGSTKNVLNLVRGRAPRTGVVHLSEVVNRALLAVASRLGQGLRLELELEPVPEVQVEETAVHQALVNLLLNAVDAAPQGHAQVRIAVRSAGDEVCISVADNGPGISPEQRARLFRPLATGKAERGGVGLGLSISRALVRACGGDLTIDAGPLGGAEFTLRLKVGAPAR